jgi:hypothetical protein
VSARYSVRFTVPTEVVVLIDAESEEDAADEAQDRAQQRLSEIAVYSRDVAVFGDVDGIGPDEVEQVSP